MRTAQPEPRIPVDFPVRLWGMTAEGRPFNQQARAKNISSAGAMIGDVESDLRVGDVFTDPTITGGRDTFIGWVKLVDASGNDLSGAVGGADGAHGG